MAGAVMVPAASVTPTAIDRQVESVEFLTSNRTFKPATGVLSGNLNVPVRLNVAP